MIRERIIPAHVVASDYTNIWYARSQENIIDSSPAEFPAQGLNGVSGYDFGDWVLHPKGIDPPPPQRAHPRRPLSRIKIAADDGRH